LKRTAHGYNGVEQGRGPQGFRDNVEALRMSVVRYYQDIQSMPDTDNMAQLAKPGHTFISRREGAGGRHTTQRRPGPSDYSHIIAYKVRTYQRLHFTGIIRRSTTIQVRLRRCHPEQHIRNEDTDKQGACKNVGNGNDSTDEKQSPSVPLTSMPPPNEVDGGRSGGGIFAGKECH
jgi:hypothetical protein